MSSQPRDAIDASDVDLPLFTDARETLLSAQAVVGRKWVPLIVYHLLADGPMGFSALRDRIGGVSSKMLSESLDDLEAAGLVQREVLSDRPIRVSYELTERGAALEPVIAAMVDWGAAFDEPTDDARPSSPASEPGR